LSDTILSSAYENVCLSFTPAPKATESPITIIAFLVGSISADRNPCEFELSVPSAQ